MTIQKWQDRLLLFKCTKHNDRLGGKFIVGNYYLYDRIYCTLTDEWLNEYYCYTPEDFGFVESKNIVMYLIVKYIKPWSVIFKLL